MFRRRQARRPWLQFGLLAFAIVGLVLLLAVAVWPLWDRYHTAQRVESLQSDSFPVRTIDPFDDNFSDLEPLAEILRDRRFVLMSELTHYDGATFDARTRLVRFLHQRLGFDVVCMEASFASTNLLYRRMQSGEDFGEFLKSNKNKWIEIAYAAQRPLLDYIQGTQNDGKDALKLMGCSVYYFSDSQLGDDITAFFDEAGLSLQTIDSVARLRGILAPLTAASRKPTDSEITDTKLAVETLRRAIRDSRESLERVHSTDTILYFDCLLQSLPAFAMTATMDQPHHFQRDARQLEARDRAMAEIVIRAANERFPKSKFIVMAAHAHLLRMADDFRPMGDVPSMGDHLYRAFGESIYTIAFDPYSGSYGLASSSPIPPAAPGTLADLFHQTGQTYSFLDFTRLPDEHWLRHQQIGVRTTLASAKKQVWPRIIEGVFFIDEERPILTPGTENVAR